MIEKHYGKYLGGDAQEQLKRLFGGKTETFTETQAVTRRAKRTQVAVNAKKGKWSGRVDLNHRLHGPEPCALPS